jgi:hypothetical protein
VKAAQYLVVGWLPSPAVERGDLSRGERRDQLLCVEPFKGSTGQRERQMEQEFTVCDCLPALRNLTPNSFRRPSLTPSADAVPSPAEWARVRGTIALRGETIACVLVTMGTKEMVPCGCMIGAVIL